MVSASLRKKSDQVRRSRSTVLVTRRRSAKNSFFMWTRSHWRHMRATFAARQSCSVLHSAARHSVDAPLRFTSRSLSFTTILCNQNAPHTRSRVRNSYISLTTNFRFAFSGRSTRVRNPAPKLIN